MEEKPIRTFEELVAQEYKSPILPVKKREIVTNGLPIRPINLPTFKVYVGEDGMAEFQRLQRLYGEGISTGYGALDKFFKFLPEQLYVLSGSTHNGKTMMALNICARAASRGKRVLFASLEQGIFVSQFVDSITEHQYPETFSILDTHEMLSVKELTTIISNLEERPHLVCIDHLHFLKKKGRGATEDIDEIILEVQNMAKALHVPVLAISHVRKINVQRPPELEDLRDSSSLAQVPSVVLFIYRRKNEDQTDGYFSNDGLLLIPKNRIQGKTGAIKFYLDDKKKITFEGEDEYVENLAEGSEPPY